MSSVKINCKAIESVVWGGERTAEAGSDGLVFSGPNGIVAIDLGDAEAVLEACLQMVREQKGSES